MIRPYAQSVTLTGSYVALGVGVVTNAELLSDDTNAVAYIQENDGGDCAFQPGQSHVYHALDLSQISMKGTVGNIVRIIGEINAGDAV